VTVDRQRVQGISLTATNGEQINVARQPGRTVCFFYPYTGHPEISDPPGWDKIPGAHGSTAQALAFSKNYDAFKKLGVNVFGISLQTSAWQKEFVERNKLRFPLLHDEEGRLSNALSIPRFKAGKFEYLKRTTLIVDQAHVVLRRDEVDPQEDANMCLAWLAK
jgi:peroxiredoxin